jgi:peptidoglycan/LPS O-acetylase OafA/YrhL
MSAAETTTKRIPRILEFDALRGLCALTVIAFHTYQGSWQHPGAFAFPLYSLQDIVIRFIGWMLAVFFLSSAFGVGISLARPVLEGRRPPAPKDFLVRRLAGIVPLYAIVAFVVWETHNGGSTDQWIDLGRVLSFTQIYSDDRIFRVAGPLWFVAVLVHLYVLLAFVVIPLLNRIAAFEKRAHRVRALYGIAGVLFAAAFAWRGYHYLNHTPIDRFSVWFNWPAWLDHLGLGFGLAVLVVDRGLPKVGSRAWALGLVLTGIGIHATVAPHQNMSPLVAPFALTIAGCAWLLVMGGVLVAPYRSLPRRLLRARPLLYLGTIGTMTYLLQDPLLRSLKAHRVLDLQDPHTFVWTALCGIAIALAAGALGHHLVEMPVARFSGWVIDGRPRRTPRTVGRWGLRAGVAIPERPVVTVDGPIDLAGIASRGPLVLMSVPGVDPASPEQSELTRWRPLLRELRDWRFAIEASGGRIVGVSRLAPEALARIAQEERLGFDLASDPDGELLSSLEIPTVQDGTRRWTPTALAVTGEGGRIASVIPTDRSPFEIGGEVARVVQAAPQPTPAAA